MTHVSASIRSLKQLAENYFKQSPMTWLEVVNLSKNFVIMLYYNVYGIYLNVGNHR